jgi:hypothetical protein
MGGSSNALVPSGQSGQYACVCNGGTSHCPGCSKVQKYKSRSRPKAADGYKGPSGSTPKTHLYAGTNGAPGSARIVVSKSNGETNTYSSKFNFDLRDFDIVDENQDGIFEPGECVIIHNVRVRNSGKHELHSVSGEPEERERRLR